MKKIFETDKFRIALLFVAVMISRLPFLADGYGLDGDSWSVAISARLLHDQGIYEVSRLPGYPLQEWLTSLVISGGPLYTNLLTAVLSAFAVVCFFLILRILRFKRPVLASAAFASVPVFYIHSTTTIDYNFALAFVLCSLLLLTRRHLVPAGIMLGLAIGCRITSGAMLIPFSIQVLEADGLKANIRRIIRIAVPALLTGAMVFYPVWSEYGFGFFDYYDVPYPPIPKVLYKFSIEVWGVLGLLGLLISTALLFLQSKNKKRNYLFPRSVNEKYVIAWLVAIDLYIIAFLKLPMESGYLIPLVPFVIFIFGKYLYDNAFIFLCVTLIIAPFICTISPEERLDASTPSPLSFQFDAAGEKLNFDILKGPVLSYKSRRQNGLNFVNNVLSTMDSTVSKSVLVSGRWYNQLLVQAGDTMKGAVVFKSYLNEAEAVYYFAKGFDIYYMPRQDYYNKIMRGIDLDIYGAVPYIKEEKY